METTKALDHQATSVRQETTVMKSVDETEISTKTFKKKDNQKSKLYPAKQKLKLLHVTNPD